MVSAGMLLFAAVRYGNRALSADRPPSEARPVTARGDLADDEQSTIELFERCSQSVVYVSPMARRVQRSLFGFSDTVLETGTGSGFVWDQDGHIVTNFHVIQDAEACGVTLPDNSTYDAELIGVWPGKDMAVLRIDAPREKLVPLPLGTSGDLRVGQKVFAIGNPFGLDFTLTTGVVSALNREISSVIGTPIRGVIQTDAAINPGNSGGPLLDSAGRLIGINTTILSRSGGSAGIGFAVPADTINRIVPQLVAHGKVVKPGLGITLISDAISRRLGLDGVLIHEVFEGTGAHRAGLRPTVESRGGRIVLGDVILRIDDRRTRTRNDLFNALSHYQVGDAVKVTVDRQGKRVTVPVTLQAVAEAPRVMYDD